MLILMTVQAQKFPVTPICWVVLVVVILVMDCEIAEFLPTKLPATARTNRRINFQRLSSVTFFTLVLAQACLRNQLLLPSAVWNLFSRHLVSPVRYRRQCLRCCFAYHPLHLKFQLPYLPLPSQARRSEESLGSILF